MQDLARAFAQLIDATKESRLVAYAPIWKADAGVELLRAEVRAAAQRGDYRPPGFIGTDKHTDVDRQAWEPAKLSFAHMRGLNDAFEDIHPHRGESPEGRWPGLERLWKRYQVEGFYFADDGLLLPRPVQGARWSPVASSIRDLLTAVCRVPASLSDHIDIIRPPAANDFDEEQRSQDRRVACVSFLEDPEELSYETVDRAGDMCLRVAIRDGIDLRARIETIVREADRADVEILVLPELALSTEILKIWKEVLSDPARPLSRLRWVMPGTGNLERSDPPTNAAVLLDGQTGEELMRQLKRERFVVLPGEEQRFPFPVQSSPPWAEDLLPGESFVVLEGRVHRVGILICEDLASVSRFGAAVEALGLTLILAPVMSRHVRERRWEQQRAQPYVDKVGSTVVIAGSLPVSRLAGDEAAVGASLVLGVHGWQVQEASRADELMIYDMPIGEAPVAVAKSVAEPGFAVGDPHA